MLGTGQTPEEAVEAFEANASWHIQYERGHRGRPGLIVPIKASLPRATCMVHGVGTTVGTGTSSVGHERPCVQAHYVEQHRK